MHIGKVIHAVDSHTAGMSTRVIISGVPVLKGKTMMEKKENFLADYDYIRRACMLEPRGHENMFGAVLTEPCDCSCDYGVIFIDTEGCLNMCGHGTIGVSTVLVEQGMVKVTQPYTDIRLDTSSGPVSIRAKVENGKAVEITFRNVPAFLYAEGVATEIPGVGEVNADIAFGGSFFALVSAEELEIGEISREKLPEITAKALALRDCINTRYTVTHPSVPIKGVDLVEIYGPARTEGADMQNVVIFGHGEVDRSPCGTGTCAKLAALVSKGKLPMNTEFVHESILNTFFRGKAVEKTRVGTYDAIVPEITGCAYITGLNTLLIDEQDPFRYGFSL